MNPQTSISPAFESKKTVTIVLLAYNEGESLPGLLIEVFKYFETNRSKLVVDILVVDDGSTDNTIEIVSRQKIDLPIRILSHRFNKGYGAALSSGLENATADYILIMDGDGQYDISDLMHLLDLAEVTGASIVSGKRTNRADNYIRKINGYLWTKLTSGTIGHSLSDIDCGFKLIRRPSVQKLLPLKSTGAFAWTELVFLVTSSGGVVKEHAITHRKRIRGSATGNSPLVVVRALFEWLRFLLRAKQSKSLMGERDLKNYRSLKDNQID